MVREDGGKKKVRKGCRKTKREGGKMAGGGSQTREGEEGQTITGEEG